MEGFNNKIRWLMRQAYGYRDEEYFHLKIYDLPEIKTKKELQQLCNKTQKRLKNGTANTKTLEIQTLIEYCFYYSRLPMKKLFLAETATPHFAGSAVSIASVILRKLTHKFW
jgi:hypothetical protein